MQIQNKIIKYLDTFVKKFKYDNSLENITSKGKKLEKKVIQKWNDILLPEAPYEINASRINGEERIEIFGINDYVKTIKTSMISIMNGDSTPEIEANKLRKSSDLDADEVLLKKTVSKNTDDDYGKLKITT